MIGYLRGQILEHAEGRMLVGVGDRQSMLGYAVSVPQSAAYGILGSGQEIELFIYTHVREDALDLYGFTSKLEKSLFLVLLGVNGIGPKSALGILSAVSPAPLIQAITEGDQAALTRIPGIGKKTAERVVVELRDTVRKKIDLGSLLLEGVPGGGVKGADAGQVPPILHRDDSSQLVQDAKDALLSLGYRDQDIHSLIHRVLEQEGFIPKRAEDLVKNVLRQL